MNIWQMSIQGGLMIAVIVIIRALGFGKLPKWSIQALWAVAIARLLIPFQIPSPLSLYGAVDRVMAAVSPAVPEMTASAPMANTVATAVMETVAAPAPLSPWPIIWAAVAGSLLAWFAVSHLRGRRVYADSQALSSGRLPGPLPRRVALRSSARVDAPLTYGIFRPVILIPDRLRGEAELDCVLSHELAHVRHWDALKKWALAIALCAHWFNPLVWALYVLANRDIELSCDEDVLRQGAGKARYATMLIDMEAQRAALSPVAAHFNRTAIEERIVAIMKYKKVSFIGIVLSILLVTFTSCALATSAMPRAAESVTEVIADTAMPVLDNSPIASASYGTAVSSTVTDPEEEAEFYAPYAPFGLVYNKQDQRLYYNGQLVRYFQDMTAFEDGTSSGTIRSNDGGSIDVYALREKPVNNLTRGALVGLKPYTQEEFDARTKSFASYQVGVDTNSVISQTTGVAAAGAVMIEDSINSASAASASQYLAQGTMYDDSAVDESVGTGTAMEAASAGWKYLAIFALPDGAKVDLGSFETYVDRYEAVRDYCAYIVREGGMTQAQADQIVKNYK